MKRVVYIVFFIILIGISAVNIGERSSQVSVKPAEEKYSEENSEDNGQSDSIGVAEEKEEVDTFIEDHLNAEDIQYFIMDQSYNKMNMIGETDKVFVIAAVNKDRVEVMSVDKEDLPMKAILLLDNEIDVMPKLIDEYIIHNMENNIEVYDVASFELVKRITLPSVMEEYISYDICVDLNTIVYSNDAGLYVYDISKGTNKLLDRTSNHLFLDEKSMFNDMRFFDNEVIMATLYGYDGVAAFYRYDLKTGEGKYFDFDAVTDYGYESTLGGQFSLVDTKFYEDDPDRSGTVIFDMMELNYFSVEGTEDINYNHNMRVDEYWFDGVKYSVYAKIDNEHMGSNSHVLYNYTFTVYNRETRQFDPVKIELTDIYEFGMVGQSYDGSFLFRCTNELDRQYFVYIPRYWQ